MIQDVSPPESSSSRRAYLEKVVGIPFTDRNSVTILRNGDEIFPAMLSAIEEAKVRILFETFVYWRGDIAQRFAETLAEKSRQGVAVRVLLDAYGASEMKKDLVELMRNAGVSVRYFRPLNFRFWDFDKRTHRKLLVCDHQVAFTGGVGIAAEWEGDARDATEWRDSHYRFEGPAVGGLSGAFWNNWIKLSGEALPNPGDFECLESEGDTGVLVMRSSPASHQSEMELLFEGLIALAREKLVIVSPYFVISGKTVAQLCDKAASGVDIEILLPDKHIDKKVALIVANECLKPLLDAGVVVRRYQVSMIHAKLIRVDDDLACVGSPNFNHRSRKKDFEVAAVLQDKALCRTLDEHYKNDVSSSDLVDPDSIKRPGFLERICRSVLIRFREQL
jgi:cardiolipin synthase